MPEGKKRREIKRITRYQIIENIILAAIFLVTAYLLYDYIFTTSIIISILKGVALLSVLAVAESMALACGGIDLSVANISLLSAAVSYYLMEKGIVGAPLAITAGIIAATALGIVNGMLIAKSRVQPAVATMATGLFAYGVSSAITNNIVLFDTAQGMDFIKSVLFGIVPVSFLAAVCIAGVCYALFQFTVISRQVFAVGGSERSAKLSGLNTDRIKWMTYAGAGLLAGFGGLMILADSAQAARFFGAGAEVEVLFAAILGGVTLYSGPRIFLRAFAGAAMIAVINRILYGLFVFNYQAFGWSVQTVDGHDVKALYDAFAAVPFEKGKPSLIVAKTKKGRGVSFMEDNVDYHHWHPGEEEATKALGEMEQAGKRWA